MALTPLSRFKKIRWIKNNKSYCFIAKSFTVKSFLLGDSIVTGLKRYDDVWKNCFSNTLNFGTAGDLVENAFLTAINTPEMPYLQHVIILCGTNNINKNLQF